MSMPLGRADGETGGVPLRFRVLGPLEVLAGDRPVRLGGLRQQTILAVLLLEEGRIVSVDRLVEAVWGDHPPATARGQIAICISRLRQAFAAAGAPGEVIVTSFPGYLAQVAPDALDARLAERGLAKAQHDAAEGRVAAAAAAMREILSLWRGPVLAGLTGPVIESEVARLEERRLAIVEESMQLELRLGRYQELIGELTALVLAHPLRERPRSQLMLALYHAGRRAEALETYRQGRRHLVEALGLEPGPELQRLHDAMLRGDAVPDPASLDLAAPRPAAADAPAGAPLARDPAGAADADPGGPAAPGPALLQPGRGPSVTPAQLPPDVPAFTGRQAELAALDALLDAQPAGTSLRIALITGIAGVGKTGLAVHWAHRVAHRFPDGQLFVNLRGYDQRDEPLAPAAVIDRFLRALGVPGERVPEDLDERAALLRTVLDGRRVLLVLDDAKSSSQVRPLLPGTRTCCVVVTSRDRLDGLIAHEGARRLQLAVFNREEAAELLGRMADIARVQADPSMIARLGELCDGLPLALRVAVARLAARPDGTVAELVARLADERRRLDELSTGELEVRASFALSYRDLAPGAAAMFRRLGLLDAPDFAAWAGAALLDTGMTEAETLIDQLVDAQMLEAAGRDLAGQARYRFHDLIRLFARERSAAEEPEGDRAAAVTRVLGGLLALAEEAHGREYGGAGHTLVHSGASRWRLDADTVKRLLADPLAWLEAERLQLVAAIGQAARAHLAEHCWDLALTALTLFEARSFFDDWRATSERALAAARLARDARGEAAMLHSLAALHLFQQRFGEAAELGEAAMRQFDAVGEEHGYALALRNAALLDRNAGRFDAALSRYEEAAAILRRVGDRYAEAHVLGGIAQIKLEQGLLDDSERLLNQALAMCRAIGSRRGEAQLLYRLGELFVVQERLDWAAGAFSEVLRLVRDRGDSIGEAYALQGLGDTQLRQGLLPAAEANLSQAFGIARAVGERFAEARACLALGKLYTASQRLDRAESHLLRAARVFAEIQSSLWEARALDALGTVQELRGDPTTARGTWSRALSLFTATGAPEAACLATRLSRPPRQLPM